MAAVAALILMFRAQPYTEASVLRKLPVLRKKKRIKSLKERKILTLEILKKDSCNISPVKEIILLQQECTEEDKILEEKENIDFEDPEKVSISTILEEGTPSDDSCSTSSSKWENTSKTSSGNEDGSDQKEDEITPGMTEHAEPHFVQVGSWKTGLCQHIRRAFSTPHLSNYVVPLCTTTDVADTSAEVEYMDKETPIEVSEKMYTDENLTGVPDSSAPEEYMDKETPIEIHADENSTVDPKEEEITLSMTEHRETHFVQVGSWKTGLCQHMCGAFSTPHISNYVVPLCTTIDVMPGKMVEESENTDTTRSEPVGDGTVYDQSHTNNDDEDSEANDKVAAVESENSDPKEDEITPSTTDHTPTHYVQVGSRTRRLCQYIRRVISSLNFCDCLFRQCISVDVADSSTEVQYTDKETPTEACHQHSHQRNHSTRTLPMRSLVTRTHHLMWLGTLASPPKNDKVSKLVTPSSLGLNLILDGQLTQMKFLVKIKAT
uniref:uncharacterized protein LOC123459450 n=1 Tax=Jaculus jaculus TaxID=51337 RepID=UPI001E1B1E2E|nr:uncharacterized protein LOC123459450 [Jaculus jaculus]